MRPTLLLLFLAAGCEDFGKLEKSFCDPAHVSYTPDGGDHTKTFIAALCDDFELSTIDATKWQSTNVTSGATLETEHYKNDPSNAGQDPEYAYRGSGVLHALAPANGAAQLIDSQVTPLQRNPAIRAFVWSGLGQIDGTVTLFSLVDAKGNDLRTLTIVDGVPTLIDVASGTMKPASGQMSQESWNCINFFSRDDRMDVLLDNGAGGTLPALQPTPVPVAAARIGLARGNDTTVGPSEAWLDEVIIDTALIGCGP